MKCPKCGDINNHYVLDSRHNLQGNIIRRRRQCYGCRNRWTTIEICVPWGDYKKIKKPVRLQFIGQNPVRTVLKLKGGK